MWQKNINFTLKPIEVFTTVDEDNSITNDYQLTMQLKQLMTSKLKSKLNSTSFVGLSNEISSLIHSIVCGSASSPVSLSILTQINAGFLKTQSKLELIEANS
ncbi:hypothetical protein BpHYR1_016222 [Brachionus plicatilis]|uniref:Uncharacterized protein n=1 Tax=Brachionus plicatilis TaxID=10195 RepID=A0A3M7RQU6_BRAPC|nr:hypothetical protein BpHYR1_016222 [Brachionus plicatilis]